jgi:hypothetical protein
MSKPGKIQQQKSHAIALIELRVTHRHKKKNESYIK